MRDGILKLYGLADVSSPSQPWHSLRHSYGAAQARAGVPVEVVRKAMGHKRIETTLRCFHIDDDDLLAAAMRVYGDAGFGRFQLSWAKAGRQSALRN